MQKQAILFFLCLFPALLLASFYSEGKYSGWYCFEDKETHKEKEKEDFSQLSDPVLADDIVKEKAKKLIQYLNLAQLNPTSKNIAQFLKLNAEILDRGLNYGYATGRFLLEHPEYTGSKANPALSSFGRSIEKKRKEAKDIATIDALKEHFVLFVFCNGNCDLANEAATIAQLFAVDFGWKLRVFSLNQQPIKTCPNWKPSNQLEEAFHISQTPAFFIVDPLSWNPSQKTFEAYLVGTGIFSVPELVDNIVSQAEHYKLLGASQ